MSEEQSIGFTAEDLEDFFENSLNGHLVATPDGTILRANARMASWLGSSAARLEGTRFSNHLTVGGKILYETHLSPLLRMQGFFSQVALELHGAEGKRIPVFANAQERRDATGKCLSIHLALFSGDQRRMYEDDLRQARNAAEATLTDERQTSGLREQFIAVLGHDLRNPLSSITMGTALLKEAKLEGMLAPLVDMMDQSASRMSDLIADVMDFARGRLGGGISVERKNILLEPILRHVVGELGNHHKGGVIYTELDLPTPVYCDPVRLSQLLSNLVGNAITHGRPGGDITVRGVISSGQLELSVSNTGTMIPPEAIQRLFEPFTRDEVRASAQGLGLGLYIASQIALAHAGALTVNSTPEETRFTLMMPTS